MIARIIELSLKNKFIVFFFVFALVLGGSLAMRRIPLDAIPDLSDVQVIIFTEYPGQAPRIIEDQITYPITTQMLAVPYAKVVRGYSFFGFSFVYVIFEDGTDMYWARSRVLEYMNYVTNRLPRGVNPTIGPDATGVGWAFIYTLASDHHDLQQLRSIQDWYLKYELTGVPGVSEVASVGGFVKQYQVVLDPEKLRAYGIPLQHVRMAIQRSNNEVGGRVLEMSETEYMLRALGYVASPEDLRKVAIGVRADGTPILLTDVGVVELGPDMRRGIAEWNGLGEAVGGIVVMRFGTNVLDAIGRVRAKLEELKEALPEGVFINIAYDRSALIERSIDTLTHTLIEESIIVSLVCVIFLLHLRSALVIILSLPLAILASFIVMYAQGLGANIMSLGGIAIAIGAMVDASIIMVENAHKHYQRDRGKKPHLEIIRDSACEVGPTLFFSLLIITVSFMPIFTLQAQEGRLFKPLAFTKTYSMGFAALLAVTVSPVLMLYLIRGRIPDEERNIVNRLLTWAYHPFVDGIIRSKGRCCGVILVAALVVGATWFPYRKLGSEFMPPLYEGDLLYMPTMLPGVSITKAREVLQQTDKIIKSFPEVETVFGKAGRAETATDPAPLSMIETTIRLKPEEEWPEVDIVSPHTGALLAHRRRTPEDLVEAMDSAIRFPGVTNAWTMPIKTRIDMLSTGIKTPIGIKISGADLGVIERIGEEVEAVIRRVPGTLSAYAERVMGGNYLNFAIDRDLIARYGLTLGDVQDVIQSAIGGMNVATTVEGLERYPINLRYGRELREDIDTLKQVLVATPRGDQIPLGQLCRFQLARGAPSIKSENSRPNAWIYVDIRNIDVGTYVGMAKRALQEAVAKGEIKIPNGYFLAWSGQYEYMERANERLLTIVPLTLLIVVLLIQLNTRHPFKTLLVILALPFSAVGAVWFLFFLGYNMSIAVWVGVIALLGVSAETGMVMLVYLDIAYNDAVAAGRMRNLKDLEEATYHGAVKRIRPKMMTVLALMLGLVPILWSSGTGADVMKRMAAPMVGGILTSFVMELVIYPAVFFLWRGRQLSAAVDGETK